jgi:hypothetical protein
MWRADAGIVSRSARRWNLSKRRRRWWQSEPPSQQDNICVRHLSGHSAVELAESPRRPLPPSPTRSVDDAVLVQSSSTHKKALQTLVSSLLSPVLNPPWQRALRYRASHQSQPLRHLPVNVSVDEIKSWSMPPRSIEPSDLVLPSSSLSSERHEPLSLLSMDAAPEADAEADVDETAVTHDLEEEDEHRTEACDFDVALLSDPDADESCSSPLTAYPKASSSVPKSQPQSPPPQPHRHAIVGRIIKCLHAENRPLAMELLHEIMHRNQQLKESSSHVGSSDSDQEYIELPPGVAKGLFRMMGTKRPFDLYQILMYYRSLTTTTEYALDNGHLNSYARMYNRLCDSLRHLDPQLHATDDSRRLVTTVYETIQQFDAAGQAQCWPTFVSAMVAQKSHALGTQFARPAYQEIVSKVLTVPDGFWVHLLSFSRFNRQADLPFEDVLVRMVNAGRRPRPVIVLNVLDNLFPFTGTNVVATTLGAILRLQQQVVESARDNRQRIDRDNIQRNQYFVDIRTLEMIGAAAASQGNSDVNLLVWDMLDVLGYEPSEAIYENTVTAFAMNTFTYREAFTVLAEMEARGFKPSRALLRSFSLHVRYVTLSVYLVYTRKIVCCR